MTLSFELSKGLKEREISATWAAALLSFAFKLLVASQVNSKRSASLLVVQSIVIELLVPSW